jgi:hypothetical protein
MCAELIALMINAAACQLAQSQQEMNCAAYQKLVFEPEWTQTPPKNIEPASSPVNPMMAALLANLETGE